MAEEEKTEQATPKKLREARKKGQIAKSIELSGAIVLLSAVLLFYFKYSSMISDSLLMMRHYYGMKPFEFNISNTVLLFRDILSIFMSLVAPFMIVLLIVSIFSNVVQFGFLFTTKPLEFKLDKLNPVNGLKNMFSVKALGEMIKSVLKIVIILYVAYLVIKSEITASPELVSDSLRQSFYHLLSALWNLMLYLVLLILLLAIIDFFFQRYVYMKNQRMSKFEVKEELRQMEGDPLVRARIRRLQREMAKKRMMAAVKDATVVITNPTHFAIALKYEAQKTNAPIVVAKGVDSVALKIKEIARQNDVPIVENPPLVRAMYRFCNIDKEIPEKFYKAVAEIIAYIWKKA